MKGGLSFLLLYILSPKIFLKKEDAEKKEAEEG
jgi:hypothetical protein